VRIPEFVRKARFCWVKRCRDGIAVCISISNRAVDCIEPAWTLPSERAGLGVESRMLRSTVAEFADLIQVTPSTATGSAGRVAPGRLSGFRPYLPRGGDGRV